MKKIFLDPDGTGKDYLGVIISQPTGIVYCHQCGCTTTEFREMEGYYVPIYVDDKNNEGNKRIVIRLRGIFHEYQKNKRDIVSGEGLLRLNKVLDEIYYWETDESRTGIGIDPDRKDELMEAWIPIIAQRDRGVLIWPNCD